MTDDNFAVQFRWKNYKFIEFNFILSLVKFSFNIVYHHRLHNRSTRVYIMRCITVATPFHTQITIIFHQ